MFENRHTVSTELPLPNRASPPRGCRKAGESIFIQPQIPLLNRVDGKYADRCLKDRSVNLRRLVNTVGFQSLCTAPSRWLAEQSHRVSIRQLKKHFQFTAHLNSLLYTFYFTKSINLTPSSGTHSPSRCLLTPFALFSSHHFWFSSDTIITFLHTSSFRHGAADTNAAVILKCVVKM